MNSVAMALYAATGGSADGLRLLDAWSMKSSKYDASNTQDKWEKLTRCPPDEIDVGSIFFWVEQAVGEDWRERLREPKLTKLIDSFLVLMENEQ